MSDNVQSIRDRMHKFKDLSPFCGVIDDMTSSEYMMLKMINRHMQKAINNHSDTSSVGIKTTTLSELLCISKPAVSQMLNALEYKGFIMRGMTKHDRRVVFVVLTPEGAQKFSSVQKRVDDFAEQVFIEMGETDSENLIRLLDKMYLIVEDIKQKNHHLAQ